MSPPALYTRGRGATTTGSNEAPVISKKTFNRKCQFCERTFSKTEHVLRHERSHTKERPFRCLRCNRIYSRHDTLLRHRKSHDPPLSPVLNPNMASDAAVRGIHAGLPLSNSSSSSQDVIATDFQEQDSTAKNWHGPTQNLQTLNPPNSTSLADARLLQRSPFPTTQPQDTQTFYSHCEMGNGASDISHDEGLIPMPLPVIHGDSPLSASNLWGDSLVLSDPPWLIGYDFDLEALNTSVSATVDISQPLFQSRARFQDIPPILEGQTVLDAEAQQRSKSGTDKVRAAWFTQIDHNGLYDATHGGTNTGQATPVISGNQYDIGDNFRSRITARLRAPTFDDPLPSTKFLNHSVQIYFTKFNNIFPVIHGQTFHSSPKNSLLLLSITSIGSLLLGSRAAAAQGIRIFERLNKAILASWEQSLLDPREAKSMIQASLIGQTFGLLSGIPKHLAIVEAFHGTVIAWGRRCNLFTHKPEKPDVSNLTGSELHRAWNSWARSEELVRTIHGLYIHDAMLSRQFHHTPLLRHDSIIIPPAADDDLFNAPTADAWKQLVMDKSFINAPLRECLHVNLQDHRPSQPVIQELGLKQSTQTAYVVINGISALVSEKQQMGQLGAGSIDSSTCFDALTCWHFTFACTTVSDFNDASQSNIFLRMIKVLWHTVFMELVTNFDVLERAVGRDGPGSPTAQHDLDYAREWANSKDAERCILHTHMLLQLIGGMRLDTEPAIHIPHCLFLAGIAAYSYTKFHRSEHATHRDGERQTVKGPIIEPHDFPEFSKCGIPFPKHLFQPGHASSLANSSLHGYSIPESSQSASDSTQSLSRPHLGAVSGLMFSINELLQRIGHWGVARKYASTLSTLARSDGDEDWALIMNDF